MPNPVFTYISNLYDLYAHFGGTFLNEPELILLYIVKWFQVFLSNINLIDEIITGFTTPYQSNLMSSRKKG